MSTAEFNRKSVGVVIAASVGLLVSVGPLVASTFGIFMASFGTAFGWSRTSFSAVILLTTVVGALGTPIAGRAIDRFGARRVILPGVFCFGLAMAAVSLVQGALWQVYLAYAVVGVFAGIQNAVAYSKLLSQWFRRNRGKVLAIMSTAAGLSYAIVPQVTRRVIADHGWQAGYWLLGGLCIAALVVLVPLLREPAVQVGHSKHHAAGEGDTAAAARVTKPFWMLTTLLFLAVVALVGTVAHVFPMMLDRGLTGGEAASVLSLFALGTILGQISYGFLLDRFDTPRVAAPYFLLGLIGMTIVHRAATTGALLPGAVLMGIGQGAELGLAAYFVGRYFGTRHFGEIYGLVFAAATLAAGVGPVLFGLSFDALGGYGPMMTVSEVALALVVVGILAMPAYRYPRLAAAPATEPKE